MWWIPTGPTSPRNCDPPKRPMTTLGGSTNTFPRTTAVSTKRFTLSSSNCLIKRPLLGNYTTSPKVVHCFQRTDLYATLHIEEGTIPFEETAGVGNAFVELHIAAETNVMNK
nr:uncharacterized protein LOC115254889 [Aedes albopictus]